VAPAKKRIRRYWKLSDTHKTAMSAGRDQSRAVREYLDSLAAPTRRSESRRTAEAIKERLAAVEKELGTTDPLSRLHLTQERHDLHRELAMAGQNIDRASLEQEFVKVAKAYGERKGITYSTWREFGVSAAVLKQAGISQAGG
jgi:uncharacterized protein YicC (UPF0701 family)